MKFNENINIIVSIDNNYVIHLKDLLISLSENNKAKFNIYLIHDKSLSNSNIKELKNYCINNNIGIINNIKIEVDYKKLPMNIEYITPVTYFRLFMPYLLPNIKKYIYLDCDILCTGSIEELYNIDLEDNIIAATKNMVLDRIWFDSKIESLSLKNKNNYINAGVLVVDAEKYRKYITEEEIYNYISKNYNKLYFQDQDLINIIFQNKIKLIDKIYNYQINCLNYNDNLNNTRLIHYSEKEKPWNNNFSNYKKGIPYYKFLYNHNRKEELKKLLKNQYKEATNYYKLIKDSNKKLNEIDIIIPVYNSTELLERALESIKIQTNNNYNIYIIDDGGTDEYKTIFKKYKDLNIIYFKYKENKGPGYARQLGLDISSGEYITFLDSDDTFADENSLDKLYKAIQNYDVVTSKIIEEKANQNKEWLNDNIGLHGKIYKRKFIENNNIRFNNERLNEDTYFNCITRLYGAKYNNINDLTYIWKNNKNSITRNNKKHYEEDLISYCETLLKALKTYIYSDGSNKQIIKEYIVESLLIVEDKYNIAPKSIKTRISYVLKELVEIFQKYDNIENMINYAKTNNNIRKINTTKEDKKDKLKRQELLEEYNNTKAKEIEKRNNLIKKMFKEVKDYCIIEPPFHANWAGKNLTIDSCYISYNCIMIDDGNINIGKNVFIGPNVTITTTNHAKNVNERINGIIEVKDVNIEDNVWIGAGVIILPGITIGENSIIGAGSVVTKDIPANVTAFGNPCKVYKKQD